MLLCFTCYCVSAQTVLSRLNQSPGPWAVRTHINRLFVRQHPRIYTSSYKYTQNHDKERVTQSCSPLWRIYLNNCQLILNLMSTWYGACIYFSEILSVPLGTMLAVISTSDWDSTEVKFGTRANTASYASWRIWYGSYYSTFGRWNFWWAV